eukprot:6203041-Pyramimonas_sp.AAC.1
MAAGVTHHHGHYGEYEDEELNGEDYHLSFFIQMKIKMSISISHMTKTRTYTIEIIWLQNL